MKKALSVLLALALALSLMSVSASANIFIGLPVENGFEFMLTGDRAGVIITDYYGDDTDVVIPSAIQGLPVVGLYIYTFDHQDDITGLTFPASLTDIGYWVFGRLPELTRITVEEGNPVFHSEGNCLIETESKTLVLACQNSVIPSDGSVTVIGESAFSSRKGLTEIEIPACVTKIGYGAFAGTELTHIELPEGLTEIGDSAFAGCTGLTNVVFPSGVTAVGGFNGCTALTSVTIPEGVSCVGAGGFSGCTALTSVTLPNSVTAIGGGAFKGSGLTEINIPKSVASVGIDAFAETPLYERSEAGVFYVDTWACGYKGLSAPKDIWLRDGTVGVADRAFWSFEYMSKGVCDSLQTIVMPDSMKYIGECAFMGCDWLQNIRFSDGVLRIGEMAFSDCTALKSVTLPAKLVSIGEAAFQRCPQLKELHIPRSVTEIGRNPTFKCERLTSLTVETGNPVYHSDGNCVIETASKTLVMGCQSSVIPTDGSVTTIGEWAFAACTNLTRITIPECVTKLDRLAFKWCHNLTTLYLPASLTTIGEAAFVECDALETVYYGGTKVDREKIMIEGSYGQEDIALEEQTVRTSELTSATWVYEATEIPVIPGDANGDGEANMKDVLLIRQFIAGWNVFVYRTAADANADGSVDMKDVLMIRKQIAEHTQPEPAPMPFRDIDPVVYD